MFGYEEINLHLYYSSLYFFIALTIIAAYTYYVYRFTVPPVSKTKKIILVALRTVALIVILFIFFEPVLSFTKKIILEPINLIFVDDSRSMTIKDGTDRINKVKEITSDFLTNPILAKDEIYLFGSHIRELSEDSLDNLGFDDAVTNISQIFSSIEMDKKNYSTIIMITDGVVTAGSNSINTAINLGLPIFTIGIGDTVQRKDAAVKRVQYNRLLYAETPTTISVTLLHNGLNGENTNISLYEDNVLMEQKNIVLNKTGIQNELFTYTPQTSGEKKLTVVISTLSDEFTSANNKKVFYINVLSNKVKVLILAGSPSPDLTFIKNALRTDENFTVKSLTHISKDKFAEQGSLEFVDSADIYFLIGFPSNETSPELLNRVIRRINYSRVPFFFTFAEGININKLRALQSELPFSILGENRGFREVQPQIFNDQKNNPIIQNRAHNILDAWNNLPPISQPSNDFVPKPESNVIAKINVNNTVLNLPLIISRSFSGKRSIAVLGKDIWKWKLKTVRRDYDLFNSFIINSLKWLNVSDKNKRVKITINKKNYSLGELIEFEAQVYDESINPISDAEIKLNIKSGTDNYELDMQNAGNGLYEGSIRINKKGDFVFSGNALLDGKKLGSIAGTFNIGELDLEMIDTRMNYELLNLLANETHGEFADANNYKQLFGKIRIENEKSRKAKFATSEITLWSNDWLMVIAILLFSLEWFLRKRAGML